MCQGCVKAADEGNVVCFHPDASQRSEPAQEVTGTYHFKATMQA